MSSTRLRRVLTRSCMAARSNDDLVLLMEAATWWIQTHQLEHFEKATKIHDMVKAGV